MTELENMGSVSPDHYRTHSYTGQQAASWSFKSRPQLHPLSTKDLETSAVFLLVAAFEKNLGSLGFRHPKCGFLLVMTGGDML